MVINVSLQYNGGYLPDIFAVDPTPIFVWFDGTIIDISVILLNIYYSVFCFVMLGGSAWRLI